MASFLLPHTLLGDGPHKVIAVHGWFADRSAYDPVLADLDGGAFQYALVDLRGYGEARSAVGSYTTGEAADDVLELADRLGWERFSLVGHSMGGSVAQRVLAAAGHRVRRLVGVSPVPASGLRMPPEQWELFASAAHTPQSRRAIMDFTTGGVRPGAWLDRMVDRSLAVSDAKAFRAWLDSWAGDDFHAEVAGSPVPALAVTGALDPALSADLMRDTWLRAYPQGEVTELPGAGHYAMDEVPLELIRTVEDFLRADADADTGAGAEGGTDVDASAGGSTDAGASGGTGADTGADGGAGAGGGTGADTDAGGGMDAGAGAGGGTDAGAGGSTDAGADGSTDASAGGGTYADAGTLGGADPGAGKSTDAGADGGTVADPRPERGASGV